MLYIVFAWIVFARMAYLIISANSAYEVAYIGYFIAIWGVTEILFSDSIYKFRNGISINGSRKLQFKEDVNKELLSAERWCATILVLNHAILLINWLLVQYTSVEVIPWRISDLGSSTILASGNLISFYLVFFGSREMFLKSKSKVYEVYLLLSILYNVVATVCMFVPRVSIIEVSTVFAILNFGIPLILLCMSAVITKTGFKKIADLEIDITKSLRKEVKRLENTEAETKTEDLKDKDSLFGRWTTIGFSFILVAFFGLSINNIIVSKFGKDIVQLITIGLGVGITIAALYVEAINNKKQNKFFRLLKVRVKDEG